VLIGFPSLCAVVYNVTAIEWSYSQLYDMHPAWCMVPQYKLHKAGGLKS
jgi:hypothetical protein